MSRFYRILDLAEILISSFYLSVLVCVRGQLTEPVQRNIYSNRS